MRSSGRSGLSAALAMLLAAGGLAAVSSPPAQADRTTASERSASKAPLDRGSLAARSVEAAMRAVYGGAGLAGHRYPKRTPNWTNARYRRAAQKRRNVLRNRRR